MATTLLFGEDVWKSHLPALAPLPAPFVAHIFRYPHELRPSPVIAFEPLPILDQVWLHVQRARENVSRFLVPAVEAQGSSIAHERDWIRRDFKIYSGVDSRLPRTSLQTWIKKGLLRSIGDGESDIEPNSVAALYMMRYLFERDQYFWLPKHLDAEEPWFYVWGIGPYEKLPRAYPYPLPKDLPADLLLWTQWLGAGWYPGWLTVPGMGALAWGRTIEHAGKWYWNLTEDEMEAWDRSFVRYFGLCQRAQLFHSLFEKMYQGFPDAQEHYSITRTHDLAKLLLQHVGEPILAGYLQHYFDGNAAPTKPYTSF